MKKREYKSYILFSSALLALLCLPEQATNGMRQMSLATLIPPVKLARHVISMQKESPSSKENHELRLENQLLKQQIEQIREFLLQEDLFDELFDKYAQVGASLLTKEEIEMRQKEFLKKIDLGQQAILAKLLYREPTSWNSFIWVDVGQKDNESYGFKCIAKNSPVVIGNAIVGIVEQVEKTRSKIRLITDANLTPSVRVARGGEQLYQLARDLDRQTHRISLLKGFFFDEEEKETLLGQLKQMRDRLMEGKAQDRLLAKGTVQGMSNPLWRLAKSHLKGIGFNYDYGDEEGPARELRSGKIFGTTSSEVSLIEEGDTLVTTGLDGVFPAGFTVGIVSKIAPLKEGSYTYDIEAVMSAGSLQDLNMVWILPPLCEEEEMPCL